MAADKEMTDAQRNRRSNKPLMERRRRERINKCLNELKTLVLFAQKKDPSRYSKLEKADILEMTVRHVESLHRSGEGPVVMPDPARKFRAGFSKCAAEVDTFLRGVPGLPADLSRRVFSHLNNVLITLAKDSRIKEESKVKISLRSAKSSALPLDNQPSCIPKLELSSSHHGGRVPEHCTSNVTVEMPPWEQRTCSPFPPSPSESTRSSFSPEQSESLSRQVGSPVTVLNMYPQKVHVLSLVKKEKLQSDTYEPSTSCQLSPLNLTLHGARHDLPGSRVGNNSFPSQQPHHQGSEFQIHVLPPSPSSSIGSPGSSTEDEISTSSSSYSELKIPPLQKGLENVNPFERTHVLPSVSINVIPPPLAATHWRPW